MRSASSFLQMNAKRTKSSSFLAHPIRSIRKGLVIGHVFGGWDPLDVDTSQYTRNGWFTSSLRVGKVSYTRDTTLSTSSSRMSMDSSWYLDVLDVFSIPRGLT